MMPRKAPDPRIDAQPPIPVTTSFGKEELIVLRFALLEAPIKGGDSIVVAQLLAKIENGIRAAK